MTGQEDRYTPGEDASAETEYSLQVVMDRVSADFEEITLSGKSRTSCHIRQLSFVKLPLIFQTILLLISFDNIDRH